MADLPLHLGADGIVLGEVGTQAVRSPAWTRCGRGRRRGDQADDGTSVSWRHWCWATGPRPRWPLPATERQIEYTCGMMGNTFGRAFTLATFGETHSAGRGTVVDGCLPIAEAMVWRWC